MNVADMETPLHKFLEKYPDYILTRSLDELRQTEYNHLDSQGLVYVDYTDGGLYAYSPIRDHMDMLRNGVFGNPHSANPSSEATPVL